MKAAGRGWAAALLGAAIVTLAGTGLAQPRVAVLRFKGPGAARVRARVVSALQGAVQLVPRERVESVAREEGLSLSMPAGRATAASRTNIDLLVRGRVRGRRRRARLTLTVYAGRDGIQVAERRLRPRGSDFGDSVRALLDEAARTARVGPYAPPPEPEPQPFDPVGGTDEASDEADEASEPSATERHLLIALGGFGLRSRSAEVITNGGAFRRYEGSVFGQLGLRLRLHPLARTEGPLGGILLEGGFDTSLGLASDDPASGERYDSSAVQWWLLAGYRHDLPVGVHIGGTLGFVSDAFTIAPNMVMPSTSYPALRLGLEAGYRALEGRLDIALQAGYRATFGVGELAEAFGADASASGWDIALRAGGALPSGIAYALEVGYRSTSIDFAGEANDAPSRSGSDGSFSVQLLGGYAL